jgi:signal recognition particle receptor subunit beta
MRHGVPVPVKVVIAGGLGVGKTTLVGTISEIEPLTTEGEMTEVSLGVDDSSVVPRKRTTTVAMDFGRITLDRGSIVLYLFGTPGQDRFSFVWDELVTGALGAIVVVDTRRLEACFAAVDYFEQREIPFVVAVNTFDGQLHHDLADVRQALHVNPAVRVIAADARSREGVKTALIDLLDTVVERATAAGAASR